MNFRLTAALFGIVFVIGVVLLILSFGDTAKTTSDVLATEMAVGGITRESPTDDRLPRVREGRRLGAAHRPHRQGRNAWQIQKPISAKADASKVMPIVTALLKAKPTPYAELSSNPAVHGLDPAGLKVTIRAGTSGPRPSTSAT